MMSNNGKLLNKLYIFSPVLMAIGKMLNWKPFSNMEWWWITSPWWYILVVVFTTGIVKHTWDSIEAKPSSEGTPVRKDLH